MRFAPMILIAGLAGLTACSGERDIRLHDLRTNSGRPEEFSIVPRKPLETPPSFAELPQPTPGGANRTDQTPLADAVAVLGGNPARLTPGAGIPAGDAAIVSRASRFGRDATIREKLAAEDLDFRTRRSRFTWSIVPTDEYFRAYRRQSLDAYQWLDRYRRAGARTPAAPPEGR
ncbi:DUF3035 domain-containing protein [Thalassococcus sp. CAU 1522]|uniref:DUF3035 domain-containing protein n=1 Tax=Thalassococcus arenae TaxID=2851652 RepID=A0ABS6N817_9RHOB|nr:DUF3035 domain-containing protein [Thalassococcus arenae]MBV2360138.1 DUF3035 domain-containing protein [Thalassococcus arenae]